MDLHAIPNARSQLKIMIYLAASARRCSASMGRGEDAPSRGLIGRSEGRNLDVKIPRDIERTCPPVYGSTYDTCRYSTPSVFSSRNPLPPIYCESRPISPLAPSLPHREARQCKSLFLRAPRFYMVRLSSLVPNSSSLMRSTTLSAYRSFLPLLPRALSFLRRYYPFVRGFSPSLSRSLPLSLFPLSLFRYCLSRSPTLFVFLISTAHTPGPAVFHSATPPTLPPSRPIQSPPRHPSFTASVAAYRLSFCHCGLFDILSTAVRTEARLSRGRREILETNDGRRKKSRTWEPILAPASRHF